MPNQDPKFLELVAKIFAPLEWYFRYEVQGLHKIPKQGSSMIVMNHGIIPYHGFLLARRVFTELKIPPRGLGASFLFEVPLLREFFIKGGAVEANPKNAEKLLRQGCCVMLAPGGIYEALVTTPGMKRIPWERREGFVRVACKTNTPIIPSYCHGIDKVYFNSKFMLKRRIKILEKTRFSIPLFWGLGLLPFPIKLTQFLGDPIYPKRHKKESFNQQVERIHIEVIKTMEHLRDSY